MPEPAGGFPHFGFQAGCQAETEAGQQRRCHADRCRVRRLAKTCRQSRPRQRNSEAGDSRQQSRRRMRTSGARPERQKKQRREDSRTERGSKTKRGARLWI